MADRYLLESGAPDGYQLEDASGVLLLESYIGDDSGYGDFWAGTMRCMATVGIAASLAVGTAQTAAAIEPFTVGADPSEIVVAASATSSGGSGGRPLGLVWDTQQRVRAPWNHGDSELPVAPAGALVDDGDTWQSGVAPTFGGGPPRVAFADDGDLLAKPFTRLYYSWDNLASGNPTPAYAAWTDTANNIRRALLPTTGHSAIALQCFQGTTYGANESSMSGQFITPPMVAGIAFSTSDSVRGVLQIDEANASNNVNRLPICVKVIAADGTTIQATLLPLGYYGATTTECTPTPTSRRYADGDNLQANYTTVLGDRLVVEIGGQVDATGGTSVVGHVSIGAPYASDLPDDETTTAAQNGWFEISRQIQFASLGTDEDYWVSGVEPTWGWPTPQAKTDTDDAPIPTPAALVGDDSWVNAVLPTWGWPTPRAQTEEGDLAVTAPSVFGLDDGQGQFRLLQRGRPMQLRVGRVLQGGAGAPPAPVVGIPDEDYWQSPATQIALNANLLASEPTWLLDASESVPAGLDENYWTSGVKPTWGWWVANAFPDNSEITVTLASPLHADDTAAWGLLGFRQAWGWPAPQAKLDTDDAPPQSPAALVHDGVPWDSGVRPSWGWATPRAMGGDDDIAYIPLPIVEADWVPPQPWSRAWLAPLFTTEQDATVRTAPPDEDFWFSGVAPVTPWHTDLRLWHYAVDEHPSATVRALSSMLRVTGLIAHATALAHPPAAPAPRNHRWTGQRMNSPLVAAPSPVFYHPRSEMQWRRSVEQKVLQMTQADNAIFTSHVAADYALSGGWGASATVSAVAATDAGGRVTIASAGAGQTASPTVTLTFKNGAYNRVPAITCSRGDGNAPTTAFWICSTPSATAPIFTFVGTPVAGTSYLLDFVVRSNDSV